MQQCSNATIERAKPDTMRCRLSEPQNIEQEMSNLQGKRPTQAGGIRSVLLPWTFCGWIVDILRFPQHGAGRIDLPLTPVREEGRSLTVARCCTVALLHCGIPYSFTTSLRRVSPSSGD